MGRSGTLGGPGAGFGLSWNRQPDPGTGAGADFRTPADRGAVGPRRCRSGGRGSSAGCPAIPDPKSAAKSRRRCGAPAQHHWHCHRPSHLDVPKRSSVKRGPRSLVVPTQPSLFATVCPNLQSTSGVPAGPVPVHLRVDPTCHTQTSRCPRRR